MSRAIVYRCDRPGCTVACDAPKRTGVGFDFAPLPMPTGWVTATLPDRVGEPQKYELCSAHCLDLVLLNMLAGVAEGES